ncbi:MAG TPA: hypothetical protein VN451_04010, partial [Chitinophagaceae bacterium]|nr:hypothetical protein [Chitinophagaceae bacterium]
FSAMSNEISNLKDEFEQYSEIFSKIDFEKIREADNAQLLHDHFSQTHTKDLAKNYMMPLS